MNIDITQKRLGKKEKRRAKKPALIYDTQALFVVHSTLKQNPIETFIYIK